MLQQRPVPVCDLWNTHPEGGVSEDLSVSQQDS